MSGPDDDRHDDLVLLVIWRGDGGGPYGYSDCLAIRNVVSTSRGRAGNAIPATADYHVLLAILRQDSVISAACAAMGTTRTREVQADGASFSQVTPLSFAVMGRYPELRGRTAFIAIP